MEKTKHPGVYQEDGRLKILVTLTHPRTGQRKRKWRWLDRTTSLSEAVKLREQLRQEFLAELQREGEPEVARITLASYAQGWMSRKQKRLKPRTAQTYTTALEQHILPQLGDLYVDAIIRADVEEWVVWAEQAKQDDGSLYAQATLRSWWRPLKQMLQDASADYGISDPTARIRPPTVHRAQVREHRTLSAAQLNKFLETMQAYEPQWYVSAMVLAYTGMRLGEMLGLRWEDVDAEGEQLHIRQSVSAGLLTDTKTHTDRTVYLPTQLAQALAEHRRQMIADQHPGLSTGLVFPSDNGKPRFGSSLRKPWERVSRHCHFGVHVTPQVLRRTYNTLLVQAGVDRIVLRAQMGHTDEHMTERYSGIPIEAKKGAHLKVFK